MVQLKEGRAKARRAPVLVAPCHPAWLALVDSPASLREAKSTRQGAGGAREEEKAGCGELRTWWSLLRSSSCMLCTTAIAVATQQQTKPSVSRDRFMVLLEKTKKSERFRSQQAEGRGGEAEAIVER